MIGIIGAIPEEINAIIEEMQISETRIIGKRKYYIGKLENKDCVVVFSRIGKVAATITTTTLIQEFKIAKLIFTGVAGGINPNVKVGDIVLATSLSQHDFDAFPLYPKNEIPLINKKYFKTDSGLNQITSTEITSFLENKTIHSYISENDLNEFGIQTPVLHQGLIVSGDQFIYQPEQVSKILTDFPEALCAEMEGAAVAQVCHEYHIPFTVIRTISDNANESATLDFNKFIEQISNRYGLWIVKHILQNIQN
ncbi:5'-methylthioadenosine/adenosylhomocysteine nucleosidase [Paenimyroides tangerinum]|uniref:adenosylhomocysteine nucleosidase n=1 Tax=Paenimyroides tangerinum TaxID=2488728 RepID=A0A3P3WC18_9FLAO|nr:5'-methylthioadenosine/adenosylhomocysteine nucleosidase [Paenimyroides tangerinum]RRJ92712.1 5'-methylthioadenosine/adenosylhomocysteine nucleosidase [Paenimyroides tangerinum]